MKKLLFLILFPLALTAQNRTFVTPHLLNDFGTIVVGGAGSTMTVAQAGVNPTAYAGITVTASDLYDWANLQYAMYLEQQTGKAVQLFGNFRGVNKGVDMGKYNVALDLDGTFAVITTTGGGTFSVLYRPKPTDNSDANKMIIAKYHIQNLYINCASTQNGLEPGPTYGSTFERIYVSGAKYAFLLQFNLQTTIQFSQATNCLYGFIYDYGKWTNAGLSGAQSNMSRCISNRCYYGAGFIGEVAFGVYSSGSVRFDDCIAEGNKVKRGIEVDGKGNTTSKDVIISNFHFETMQGTGDAGSGEACVYIRLGGGTVTIDNLRTHYAAVMIDAGTQGGWMTVDVSNISWWVPRNGKMFNNAASASGGTTWKFRNIEKSDSEIMSGFAGKAVSQGCSTGGDANKVCIQ